MKLHKYFSLLMLSFVSFSMIQAQVKPINPSNPSPKKTLFYQDMDGDSFGNTSVTAYKRKAPLGYVTIAGDCNDQVYSIHPDAAEQWNGIDDNCSGIADEGLTADLIINTTASIANHGLASVPTVDIFFTGGYKPRNITDPTYAALVKGLGARFFSSTTGVYAQYVRVYPQRSMFDGPGMGYNIPTSAGEVLQKVGLTDFYLDGKPYDFAAAGDSLRKIVGASGMIEANIASAPIEDTYVQIDRLLASGQKRIMIQPGQELVNDKSFFSTGTLYATAADIFFSSILKKYPGIDFDFAIDCAAKWKIDSKKNELWNNQASVSKYATVHDDYFHMMYMLKDGLNGNIDHDTSEIGYALKTSLPDQINRWRTDPLLKRFKLNVTQLSGAIAGYIQPDEVIKHKFYVTMFTWSAINYFNTWNATHGDSIVGCTVMTLKDMIGPTGTVTLDYQMLSVGYKLFQPGAFTCLVKHNYRQMEIGITSADSSYHVVILNHSGADVALPRYILVDGQYRQFEPVSSTGIYCETATSSQGLNYTPDMLRKYSINYFKLKPGAP